MNRKLAVGLVALVFALPLCCIGYGRWRVHRLSPPDRVRTFNDLMDWRPPHLLQRLQHDGRTYVVASGDECLIASAPSRYVFDESGRLVDWTHDSGDDGRFQKRWHWNEAIRERRFSPVHQVEIPWLFRDAR